MEVNAIWIGKRFPLITRMCARSWIEYGHKYNLWIYEKMPGIPSGVNVGDANEILPGPILKYKDKNHEDSPVLHANIFRYNYLMRRGGIVVDADTLCVSDKELAKSLAISSEGKNKHPNLAFISTPNAYTEFAMKCWEIAKRRLNATPAWGYFGPTLIKDVIYELGLQSSILSSNAYCSLHYNRIHQFFDAEPPDIPKEALGIQLWHQSLKAYNYDLSADYPSTSLWGQWKIKYG